MATLKIQSKDDIIKAYFRNWGFNEIKLQKIVAIFADIPATPTKNADELVSYLDKMTCSIAQNVFKKNHLSNQQTSSLFKLTFLQCNGADICDANIILKQKLPEELCKKMIACAFETVPECVLSDMKPQRIVTAKPTRLLKKLWSRKKRN